MKKVYITLLLVLGSLTTQAQDLVWHTDVNKAVDISAKTKKPLLLFFTGSDWCGWCIKLQKEVMKTPEFAHVNQIHKYKSYKKNKIPILVA